MRPAARKSPTAEVALRERSMRSALLLCKLGNLEGHATADQLTIRQAFVNLDVSIAHGGNIVFTRGCPTIHAQLFGDSGRLDQGRYFFGELLIGARFEK